MSRWKKIRGDSGNGFKELIDTNEKRLGEISGKVEERLDKGFEKTSKVFEDVLKRLVEIDKAQEKIAELSGNVVSSIHSFMFHFYRKFFPTNVRAVLLGRFS